VARLAYLEDRFDSLVRTEANAGALHTGFNSTMKTPTDYEIELGRLDQEISELEESMSGGAIDGGTATRLLYYMFHRASLTGNFAEFETTETAINNAIQQIGPWADLCFLKASLDFKFHRLPNTKQDLEMVRCLADSPQGKALKADIALQEGRYQEAKTGYERAVEDNRTWDNLVRLAYFETKMGDEAGAEQLYIEAEDEITAKEMRSYAWVELQRGLLDLSHGRFEETQVHYNRANEAYSGYWLIEEHIAELLGAQGKFAEAAALYKEVIGRVSKPELQQAIGELYALMGKPDEAQSWYQKALAAYLESAQRGDVHYYHHLADFYANVNKNGQKALKWAQKDLELRQNFATQAAMAWAYYRNGQFADALDLMSKALSSGVRNARLFQEAAMIHLAAGQSGQAERLLNEAAQINPSYENFHVHR
jgi:tetratricopeptide (TPR) repeat protein